ncbi:MAG: HD domain-containing protein [Ktedonobacteraceae bacterium]|nr:HD domain-containing protein [Ktedonobacteraceae bacterium]
MDIDELIRNVTSYTCSSEVEAVLITAFQIASSVHCGFQRINGDPFISHPLAVAGILAEWHAPLPVVTTGLLHEIHKPNYSRGYDFADVQAKLGPDIFRLLHATINLNGLVTQIDRNFDAQVEVVNIQHHMTSMLQQEPDAVVIKLADRLHNMRTISALPRDFQERYARIGFNIMAPLADRLGMGIVKRLMEDYSFEIINPTQYKILEQHCADVTLHQDRQSVLVELLQLFSQPSSKYYVRWQPTSLYTLYRHQIEQNARHGKFIRAELAPLRIADAGSFIILTEEEEDCYRVLGMLHKHYQPIKGQFRDLIGVQKENGYRSLHTQVKHSSGNPLNIVIRTRTMDLIAERGITARWFNVAEELLPQLPKDSRHVEKEIQAFTPEGEVKDLPQGATVLDFAYNIHTEMGHSCAGALVNGEHTEIHRPLQNGDRIEIIADALSTQPSLDWLNHVRTAQAISAIRQWLLQHEYNAMLERGRTLLDQALQPLGLTSTDAQVCHLLTQSASKAHHLEGLEDLLASIGVGRFHVSKLVEQLKSKGVKPAHTTNYVASVEALNSPGLAHDLTAVISQSGLNMTSFSVYKRADGVMAEAHINFGKTTSTQRSRIQKALEAVPYVTHVEIIHSSFFASSTQQPSSLSARHSNPYGPNVAKGSRFYGREVECERISTYLCDQPQNNAILLWGQKRIGKTSLVIRLQEQSQGKFLPVYIDVQGLKDGSTTQFLYQLMSCISLVLKEQLSYQEISAPALNKLRKDPLSYFDTFMKLTQEVDKQYPLVIILDEFQCLYSLREEMVSHSAIFSRLRSQSQHGHGIHLVLSGGGLLSQLVDQSTASLFNITYDEKLGFLEEKAVYQLIKDGLAKVGNVTDPAIDLLLNLTSGHPYYLQLLCSTVYEQAQEKTRMITSDFVMQHTHEWLSKADKSRFQHLWEGYDTDSARRNKLTLSAMADITGRNEEVEYERLAESLHHVISEQQLVQTLEDLTSLGVLKQDCSTYAIEVKLFARWLRQHWPLALTMKEGSWA